MNPAELLDEIQNRGIRLEARQDMLCFQAPKGTLTPELRQALRQHKPGLLRILPNAYYGIPVLELRQIAGDEWDTITEEERQALAKAIHIRRMRERGEVPPHYTATTICDHCGPVPSFPGVGPRVTGCVWCFRRAKGLPVPRPRSMLGNQT